MLAKYVYGGYRLPSLVYTDTLQLPCHYTIVASCRTLKPAMKSVTANFSNSLIIHQPKTKKITTLREVWTPSLNKHRFCQFSSAFTT